MAVREHWRVEAFKRMAKTRNGMPTLFVYLPIAATKDIKKHPGADRYTMCSVWPLDGNAVVVPGQGHRGIIVAEWSAFMRYVGRRYKDQQQQTKGKRKDVLRQMVHRR